MVIKRIIRGDWPWRLLVVEAVLWLAAASLALKLLPFRSVARILGPLRPPGVEADMTSLPPAEVHGACRVGAAVSRGAALAPWRPMCLPQAMAAKVMLVRRGWPATMHLGAMPDKDYGGIGGHAWVTLGPLTVIGGEVRTGYTELGRFG